MRGHLVPLCASLSVLVLYLALTSARPHPTPPNPFVWVMADPAPPGSVIFWFPVGGAHPHACRGRTTSPAEALMAIHLTMRAVRSHHAHYRVERTKRGFVLTRADPADVATNADSERSHYHGIWVRAGEGARLLRELGESDKSVGAVAKTRLLRRRHIAWAESDQER